jgi:prepilin-type N-terminal cleavage/methylation domain-containing protein
MKNEGFTLLELMIAISLVTGIIIVATTTGTTITDATTYGRQKLKVHSDNQSALYFIANDLQNSSSDTDPDTNMPRYEILDAEFVSELASRTSEDLSADRTDEYVAGVDADTMTSTTVWSDDIDADVDKIGTTDLAETAKGEILEGRPRLMKVEKNSRFTFRKITGFNVDTGIGEVSPIWSTPVTYFVRERQLIREQDGRERVVSGNVSGFKVFAEDKGNFRVFLRTQKRNKETGEVVTTSSAIEINPKNR